MIDLATLQGVLDKLGWDTTPEEPSTLRLTKRVVSSRDSGPRSTPVPLPPFFVQFSDNWVLFSMLPMLANGAYRGEDLGRRLLMANRAMRVAKFALDQHGTVVLCAELPTESLDPSEIADAVTRMVQYARRFMLEFGRR